MSSVVWYMKAGECKEPPWECGWDLSSWSRIIGIGNYKFWSLLLIMRVVLEGFSWQVLVLGLSRGYLWGFSSSGLVPSSLIFCYRKKKIMLLMLWHRIISEVHLHLWLCHKCFYKHNTSCIRYPWLFCLQSVSLQQKLLNLTNQTK